MKATKIDWCDATINPVVGCKNNCKYCYAIWQNARFGWVKNFCEPQYFPERMQQFNSKKPKAIFCDSMSDIAYWNKEALNAMAAAMERNPQHNYIFLTKGAKTMRGNAICREFSIITDNKECCNTFNGLSVDRMDSLQHYTNIFDFLSIEPLLEPIALPPNASNLRQVIIGAETGTRKGKVTPLKEWVTSIVMQADELDLHVFMKESLRAIMGKDFRQDPLIWAIGDNYEKN